MVHACVSVLSRVATCVEARGPLLVPFSISLYVLETGSPTVSDRLAGQCATRICLFPHPASPGLPVHSATHCIVCVLGVRDLNSGCHACVALYLLNHHRSTQADDFQHQPPPNVCVCSWQSSLGKSFLSSPHPFLMPQLLVSHEGNGVMSAVPDFNMLLTCGLRAAVKHFPNSL